MKDEAAQIRELYAYNRWANRRMIDVASMLPSELLTHDVGASFRSAWGTLQHIAWGEWLWLGRWQGRASSGTNPLDCPDLQTLTLHWAELEHEQTEFLRRFSGPGRSAVKRAGAFAS